ncbi:unnamed protein product [Symbiodinium natans]|uniref:Uncharacterized protein n=1 Tax=Symbiodinium natans TaxID=878477 RepID=A0A812TVT6_9DINO|nr:unnamed protein product [Symbiodinium natans]
MATQEYEESVEAGPSSVAGPNPKQLKKPKYRASQLRRQSKRPFKWQRQGQAYDLEKVSHKQEGLQLSGSKGQPEALPRQPPPPPPPPRRPNAGQTSVTKGSSVQIPGLGESRKRKTPPPPPPPPRRPQVAKAASQGSASYHQSPQ